MDENQRDKEKFLFPQSSYRGDFTPENLMFNSNLQEFAQKVSYICNLETNGKIAPKKHIAKLKNYGKICVKVSKIWVLMIKNRL